MSIADFELACTAAALVVYPIKACAGMPVQELALDARGGAAGDREWAIVDAQGVVTWQGAHPRLALVQPRMTRAGLRLGAAGADEVAVPDDLAPCSVKIWNDLRARHDTFDAADAGDAVAAWLERVVGAPLRLVRLGEAALAREGNNALHLVFTPSVAALEAQWGATDPRRFRANVVLEIPGGDGNAFIEESLAALEWQGDDATRLEITAPCIRCVVPNVDPASARVDDSFGDALTRLSQQRRPGATVFGIYARGAAGARLRVGDTAKMELAF
ncbi:MOSC domain-containing protein [Scleromatobacter humisilvae]|uniref:MOSC N-terminal beta barrel domain-containing protein n=1 Tax=Scleromatobacter humisilvae TaxID=2897159 RepID=A0A9X1YFI1_9BURK|nr:MOSC N-terminal beta barrel domain-containing protein [Scleromatobacter humisilvae]MCK9685103.1 MOSC N-terminal beta barrel domain-containing protein [Scleromatobacter humisilvae]